jgi:hypothetical protein
VKTCSKCGEDRPLDDFHTDRQKPDAHRPDCKACRSDDYQANREQIAARGAAYRQQHRAAILQRKRTAYAAKAHRPNDRREQIVTRPRDLTHAPHCDKPEPRLSRVGTWTLWRCATCRATGIARTDDTPQEDPKR